jgi:hypothetical protein
MMLANPGEKTDENSSTRTDPVIDSDSDSESGDYDGELDILLESLDHDSDEAPVTEAIERALEKSLSNLAFGASHALESLTDESKKDGDPKAEQRAKTLSLESAYGNPLSVEDAEKLMPPGEGGLIWHSLLIKGEPFDKNGNLQKGLNPRDFDLEKKKLKARRPSLPVLAKNFYSSLTRIEGPKGPRFIFHGILNGWPSLQTFEVISIQRRRNAHEFVNPAALLKGQRVWAHMWSSEVEGAKGIDPVIREKGSLFRIKFRSAPWTAKGRLLERDDIYVSFQFVISCILV